MTDSVTLVGLAAATCTTISYIPQLKKCWDTGKADDLSLKMFSILTGGIALWVIYGVMKGDWVIIVANTISLMCLIAILTFKLRSDWATTKSAPSRNPLFSVSKD